MRIGNKALLLTVLLAAGCHKRSFNSSQTDSSKKTYDKHKMFVCEGDKGPWVVTYLQGSIGKSSDDNYARVRIENEKIGKSGNFENNAQDVKVDLDGDSKKLKIAFSDWKLSLEWNKKKAKSELLLTDSSAGDKELASCEATGVQVDTDAMKVFVADIKKLKKADQKSLDETGCPVSVPDCLDE